MIKIKQPQVGAIKDYHTILPNGLITQNGVSDEVVGTQLIQRFHSFKVSDIIDFDTFDPQADPEIAQLLEDGLLPYCRWLGAEDPNVCFLYIQFPTNEKFTPKTNGENPADYTNLVTTVYDYVQPSVLNSIVGQYEDMYEAINQVKLYLTEHGAYGIMNGTGTIYAYLPAFESCSSAQEALALLDPNSTFTYELEIPIIHNLASGGNPYMNFNVAEGGTYEALPTNTPTVETMNADVVFNIDGEDVDGSLGNKTVVTESEGTWKLKKIFGNTKVQNQTLVSVKHQALKTNTQNDTTLDILPLTLTTLQGTKSDGTHEVMFPDGLKKAGNVYDEIDYSTGKAIKRVGSRAYISDDSSDNTVITDGTTTYYVLDTPIEYTIDGFIQEPKRIIANKLSEGYTELEYLQSTGTQYIDTGFVANNGMIIDAKVMPVNGVLSIGNNGATLATSRNVFAFSIDKYIPQKLTVTTYAYSDAGNTPVIVHFDTTGSNFYCTVNSNVVVDLSDTNVLENVTNSVKLGYSDYGHVVYAGRYYYVRITGSNGTLVRNLVPARRNSDNVLGMYDTVTGNFLTNAGTGEFVAGPDKNEVKIVYAGQTPVWYAYYGWDYNTSTQTVTRIGNTTWHKELPIQSKMRRCAVTDNGTVKYISSWDYTKYEDGNTVDYTGGDGQIMVEIPEYYYEAYEETVDGVVHKILKLYPYAQIGQKSKKFYCGAFEGITDDASNANTPKLYSISTLTGGTKDGGGNYLAANWTYTSNAADYRGSGGTNDNGIKSNWSRPRTSLNITDFRTRATNRGTGWSQQYFTAYNSILRLYTVEYCNFNSQAAFTSTLTAAGHHQGGLGDGVTNANSSAWSSFNGYNPFIPCGVTKELGNNTGTIGVTYASGEFTSAAYTTHVPSYRGIENPFGHIWKWTDGYTKYGEGSTATVYTCDDITKFSDSVTNQNVPDGYSMKGTHTIGEGNFGDWYWNSDGTFVHKTFGTGPFSDYAYHNNTGTRALRSGGNANISATAGLFCWSTGSVPSSVSAYIGGRLYYTPSES